jgi:guanylate kinase
MTAASPSLMRYIERHALSCDRSCEMFIAGVAAYLAVESWLHYEESERKFPPGAEILDHAPAPNERAMQYAHFFVGAVVAKDPYYGGTFSLAVTLAGVFRRVWPEEDRDLWLHGSWAAELGWCLASAADGAGVAWEDDHEEHGLCYPSIEACCDDFFVNEAKGCSTRAAMDHKRIIIVGPGGAGKDYLAKQLMERGYHRAVSCTTRPMRPNEVDGVDYHFITDREFRRMIHENKFREWYSFGDQNWLYGTTEESFQSANLFIMSPPVLKTIGTEVLESSIIVFLDIPEDKRKARLEARADADSVERRLYADAEDFRDFSAFDVRITDPFFEVGIVLEAVASVSPKTTSEQATETVHPA